MQTRKFDPNGGDLELQIEAGYALPGSYSLLVFDKDNQLLKEWHGRFSKQRKRKFTLPAPNSQYAGGLVVARGTFVVLPPGKYSLELAIWQDGQRLGDSVKLDLPADDPVETATLRIRLEKEA